MWERHLIAGRNTPVCAPALIYRRTVHGVSACRTFQAFDLILACDRQNYADLLKLAPTEARGKVHLLMHFAPDAAVDEVPDPYYGNDAGFDRTVELCRTACNGVLKALS